MGEGRPRKVRIRVEEKHLQSREAMLLLCGISPSTSNAIREGSLRICTSVYAQIPQVLDLSYADQVGRRTQGVHDA